jgi:hypothetical protein
MLYDCGFGRIVNGKTAGVTLTGRSYLRIFPARSGMRLGFRADRLFAGGAPDMGRSACRSHHDE